MSETLRLARPYFLLLAIFTIGRWLMGTFGVPYEKGHQVFSLVILTLLASVFYGMFCRRWRGQRLLQAVGLSMVLGLVCQLVILLATMLSYALGLSTYFNHPTALQATEAVTLQEALKTRLGGLIGNPISAGIAGAVGWALGSLLPEK